MASDTWAEQKNWTDEQWQAYIAEAREKRRQQREEKKQRKQALEAAGQPTGRSFKDQPEWKQANRAMRETTAALERELSAAYPGQAFHVSFSTYSPRSYSG